MSADLISRAAVLHEIRITADLATRGCGELAALRAAHKVIESPPSADPLAIIEAAKGLRVAVESVAGDFINARTQTVLAQTFGVGGAYLASIALRVRPDKTRGRDCPASDPDPRAWVIAQLRAEGWVVVERKEGGG